MAYRLPNTETFDFIYIVFRPSQPRKEFELRLIGQRSKLHGIEFDRILCDDVDVTKLVSYIFDEWGSNFYRHITDVVEQHLEKAFVDLDESDYTLQNQ